MDVRHEKKCQLCLNLLTVLCIDAVISTGRDSRAPGELEGISNIHAQLVSANFKGVSKSISYLKFCLYFDGRWRDLERSRWLALNKSIINQCSGRFKTQKTTLPSLPMMWDVVGGNCCSVTVFSVLNASLFEMVVLRSMWRTPPWIILRLLSTMMIVVLRLRVILNNEMARGIVPVVIGGNWVGYLKAGTWMHLNTKRFFIMSRKQTKINKNTF